jgi:hypothetical protein
MPIPGQSSLIISASGLDPDSNGDSESGFGIQIDEAKSVIKERNEDEIMTLGGLGPGGIS